MPGTKRRGANVCRNAFRSLLIVGSFSLCPVAEAQIPPSPAEIAAYDALHLAAHRGDLAALRHAVAAGNRLEALDGGGRTALHVAAHARQREAMRELAKAGADPRALDGQSYDAITIAAVADDLETMRIALAIGGDARAITSPYRGTALIAAAHLGHDGVVRELVTAGAPLDHVNNLGWTALIEAVILGDGGPRHVETVRALVAAGARRDLADRDGVTPLEHARRRGYTAMITLLQ
ncbi:ankyrin repeat domain-containing protein [Bosea vestrisii]|uniref:ankyrin repeat domain-containing protein n=1 Tax=Bosea vestrisii TaxID=151416 RepID=UPI0024E0065C|nr:ankyrin repeat domain-containing protein [Bosea vestrisii]WID96569.1 ankyrin repeat domain-containing protein [Bosea vestrisii]